VSFSPLKAQAVIVTSAYRRQPRPGAGGLAAAAGTPPKKLPVRRTGACGRPDAGITEAAGAGAYQRRPDVALPPRHREMEPDLGAARNPDPARPVLPVAGRDRRRLPVPYFPGFDTLGTLETHQWAPGTSTRGSCHPEIIEKEFRAVGVRAEPGPDGQERARGAEAGAAGCARPGRGVQAARAVDFVVEGNWAPWSRHERDDRRGVGRRGAAASRDRGARTGRSPTRTPRTSRSRRSGARNYVGDKLDQDRAPAPAAGSEGGAADSRCGAEHLTRKSLGRSGDGTWTAGGGCWRRRPVSGGARSAANRSGAVRAAGRPDSVAGA